MPGVPVTSRAHGRTSSQLQLPPPKDQEQIFPMNRRFCEMSKTVLAAALMVVLIGIVNHMAGAVKLDARPTPW